MFMNFQKKSLEFNSEHLQTYRLSLAQYFPYLIFKSISLPSTNLGSPAYSHHTNSSQSLTCSGCPLKTNHGLDKLVWQWQPPSLQVTKQEAGSLSHHVPNSTRTANLLLQVNTKVSIRVHSS